MSENDAKAVKAPTTAHEEFDDLIALLSDAPDPDEEGRLKKMIWERFGTDGVTFISDMANFSSTSRSLGVCHFLKMIHRTRDIVAPIIAANKGTLLKSDADNCYAFFRDVNNAIAASFDINAKLFSENQQRPLHEHIYLSVGIDYGDLLLVGNEDFYGDPVNTASKLGEDLAAKGDTLVTERALHRSSFHVGQNVERMVARISDIEITYVRVPMTQAIKRAIG
jgi:adenylate cyclase